MAEQMTGGCACGRVRFTATVHDHDAYLCHCRMCQRATGSISIAFKNVKQADVDWAREPDWYDSSPIAERPYCRECGTSFGFRFKDGTANMDLTVASFDDPSRLSPSIISAPRACTVHGSTPRVSRRSGPRSIKSWSTSGSRRPGNSRMSDAQVRYWSASDGIQLAYHELGEGRPVVLLHGLFSDATMNWIKFGHAERIAADGFRVIMPDLRAHGLSGKPHEPGHYPRGILARDLRELIALLGLADFDLGGFSLGARTTVEAVGEGLKPRRAILGGAGLEGLRHWERRKNFFLEAIELFDQVQRGDPQWLSIQFIKSQHIDRTAGALLLESFADTFMDWLKAFTMPTLVVCGSEDDDNGSAEELAAALPDAVFREVPGTHMSSVTKPELGEAIASFLTA